MAKWRYLQRNQQKSAFGPSFAFQAVHATNITALFVQVVPGLLEFGQSRMHECVSALKRILAHVCGARDSSRDILVGASAQFGGDVSRD